MTLRTKLLTVALIVAAGAAWLAAFAIQQQRIGAMKVQVQQEQEKRDSLAALVAVQHAAIARINAALARSEQSAQRAVRRAQQAEAKFAAVVFTFDSSYAAAPDTTHVPLEVVMALRVTAESAVKSCVASRDSVLVVVDTLRSMCAQERDRANTQQAIAESSERELALIRTTPPPDRGRWKWVAAGAAGVVGVLALLKGVVR